MKEEKNSRKKGSKAGAWIALVLLVLAAGGAIWAGSYFSRYLFFEGEKIPRDTTELDLSSRGLADVTALTKLKNLRSLDLRGNPLPYQAVMALKEAMPECEILYDVEVNDQAMDILTDSLVLDDLPPDWEKLTRLTNLTSLRVEHCSDPAAMAALQEAMPECAMSWDLGLGGEWYDVNTTRLTLYSQAVYYEELLAQLGWFPSLEEVEISGAVLDTAQQLTLRETFPHLRFVWPVIVGDEIFPYDASFISFSPQDRVDMEELEHASELLQGLTAVDFSDSTVSAGDRIGFREAHPELDVSWTVTLRGDVYPCDTVSLDFNKQSLTPEELAEIEDAITYLPELERVEMCDCGFSNEEMDALNKKYPDVEFIWRVYFSRYSLRTDDTYFIAAAFGINPPPIYDSHTEPLKYCTNLQGLDIGHMYITDLHFLEYMPKMKYLIIAECPASDLSPLASLPELKYLEAFSMPVEDITPLIHCTNLKSLNLCYTRVKSGGAWEALSQMPWLERLWWTNCPLSGEERRQLSEIMPNCTFFFIPGGESSGGSWRYHPYYYEMRDFFHMYYMAGGTNGVDEDGAQIIVDDHGKEFHLKNYDGSTYWWTQPQWSDMHPYIIGVTA